MLIFHHEAQSHNKSSPKAVKGLRAAHFLLCDGGQSDSARCFGFAKSDVLQLCYAAYSVTASAAGASGFSSAAFTSSSTDVQCGHLVASREISDLQNGHTFVVGASSSAAASGFLPISTSLLIAFNRQNRTNAIMRKFTSAEIKLEANPIQS